MFAAHHAPERVGSDLVGVVAIAPTRSLPTRSAWYGSAPPTPGRGRGSRSPRCSWPAPAPSPPARPCRGPEAVAGRWSSVRRPAAS
ncbi:hypothetical protein OG689_34680 [Kitasatospora sp. NBC_00240]|nr:hypothetical protein [Kitasatospora sp. NBC_00240]